MTPRILHLHVRGVYFNQIKAGTKRFEYRLAARWEPRLAGKVFDEVWIYLGYPRQGDDSRVLRRKWAISQISCNIRSLAARA